MNAFLPLQPDIHFAWVWKEFSLHNDHSNQQEINKKRLALTLELKVAGMPFIHTVMAP